MKKRIFVVDDDSSVLESMVEFLKMEGFETGSAQSGTEAREALKNSQYDLLIVDALLPGIDGFKLIAELRKEKIWKNVPIIIISGVYKSPSQAKWAKAQLDIFDYLYKPIKLESLKRRIYTALKLEKRPRATDSQIQFAHRQEAGGKFYLLSPLEAPLVGNLADVPLAVILYKLFRARATGALILKRDAAQRLLAFDKGKIVSARSNIKDEYLGQTLVRAGRITREQNEKSLAIAQKSGKRQGDVLISQGWLNQHELPMFLKKHVEERVLYSFLWTDADFEFKRSNSLPPFNVTIDRNTPTLIKEGIMEFMNPDWFQQEFLSEYGSYYLEPQKGAEVILKMVFYNRRQLKFFESIQGARPLSELMESCSSGKDEAVRLIFSWVVFGLLKLTKTVQHKVAPQSSKLDKAVVDFSIEDKKEPKPKAAQAQTKAVGPTSSNKVINADISKLSPEEKKTYEELYRFYESVKDKDYFELLGVEKENFDLQKLRKNYFEIARRMHPDKMKFKDSEPIRAITEKIFGLMSNAYEVLSKEEKRKQYMMELEGKSNDATEIAIKIMNAEEKFLKAQTFMRRKNWAKAKELLEECMELNPDEGEYLAHLAWTKLNLAEDPSSNIALIAAQKELQKAVEMAPKSAPTHYFLAMVYKLMGLTDQAKSEFEKVLEISPYHNEAKIQLKHLQKSVETDKRKSGIFSIFGKKN